MNKKVSLALAPLTAIALLSTFSCAKKGPQFEVSCSSTSVIVSNPTATQNEDYVTELSIDFTKEEREVTLPATLESVKSGNRVLSLKNNEYTYTLKENNTKADFKIPGKYVEGIINIELYLVPAPNFISETEFKDAISFKGETFLQCTLSYYGVLGEVIVECSPNVFYTKEDILRSVYEETYVKNNQDGTYDKCSRNDDKRDYTDWGHTFDSEFKTPEEIDLAKAIIDSVELTYNDFEFDNKNYTCSATYYLYEIECIMTLKFNADKKLISLENKESTSGAVVSSLTCAYGETTPQYPTNVGWVWYEDQDYLNGLTSEDIGTTNVVIVNGVGHVVRLIGVDEDVDNSGTPIHTTWEFANLISDENGYSLGTYWNDTNSKTDANDNYFNSSVRAALVGEGAGTANWFQYFGTEHDEDDNLHFSDYYANQNVLEDMLPDELVAELKTPVKPINVYNSGAKAWEEQTLEDKLFLLAYKEIGQKSGGEASATPYAYYENGFEESELRIKQQVRGRDGARTTTFKTDALDGRFEGDKYNYAGFNSATEGEGGWYLLRSPYITHTSIYTVGTRGLSNFYDCRYNAGAVAPAFCI